MKTLNETLRYETSITIHVDKTFFLKPKLKQGRRTSSTVLYWKDAKDSWLVSVFESCNTIMVVSY